MWFLIWLIVNGSIRVKSRRHTGKPKAQLGGYCNNLGSLVGRSEGKPWDVANAGHTLVELPGLGDGLGVRYRKKRGISGWPQSSGLISGKNVVTIYRDGFWAQLGICLLGGGVAPEQGRAPLVEGTAGAKGYITGRHVPTLTGLTFNVLSRWLESVPKVISSTPLSPTHARVPVPCLCEVQTLTQDPPPSSHHSPPVLSEAPPGRLYNSWALGADWPGWVT